MSENIIDCNQLKEKCFNNLDLIDQLLNQFVQNADDHLEKLIAAFEKQDWDGIRRISHRFAGESGTMCANRIHVKVREIHDIAARESAVQIQTLITELSEQVSELKEFSLTESQ